MIPLSPKRKYRLWTGTGGNFGHSRLNTTAQVAYLRVSVVAEIDVGIGEPRNSLLLVEFIEGEGFFVGEKGVWQDGLGEASGGMVGMSHSQRWQIIQLTTCSQKLQPMTQDVWVFYHCQAFSHVRSIYSVSLYVKLCTWGSLGKGPTAGDSCLETITKSVNGISGGHSLSFT